MAHRNLRIRQGELSGIMSVTEDGEKYFSFLGIPYAEPPVGSLRFKDPIPAKHWQNVRDASTEGNISIQMDHDSKKCVGDEDCLFLNVHTPQLPSTGSSLLPVMVYIHGGAFKYGSGNHCDFGPEYIVEKNCILVTMNYRLGVLGFLCLDAPFAPGNMGLKDQQLAITWVHENITSFNGDPNNVTLFGVSAGACSVESQLLYTKSSGLFHKAILQSGSVLNPWFLTRDHLDNPIRLSKRFGKNFRNPKELHDFFCTLTAQELVEESLKILTDEDVKSGILSSFTPVACLLPFHDNFIERNPIQLLEAGSFIKVPSMSGFCNKEGILMKTFYKNETKELLDDGKFIECLPPHFFVNRKEVEIELKTVYLPKSDDLNADDHVLDFLTDLIIHGGLCKSVELKLKCGVKQYFYCFSYDGNMNYLKCVANFKEKGTCHADEVTYLGTNGKVSNVNASPLDIIVRKRMVQMWTDFAKTGDPTPVLAKNVNVKWLSVNDDELNMLDIGNELVLKNKSFTERRCLWKKIYKGSCGSKM